MGEEELARVVANVGELEGGVSNQRAEERRRVGVGDPVRTKTRDLGGERPRPRTLLVSGRRGRGVRGRTVRPRREPSSRRRACLDDDRWDEYNNAKKDAAEPRALRVRVLDAPSLPNLDPIASVRSRGTLGRRTLARPPERRRWE